MQNHLILIFPLELPHALKICPASEEKTQDKYSSVFQGLPEIQIQALPVCHKNQGNKYFNSTSKAKRYYFPLKNMFKIFSSSGIKESLIYFFFHF